MAKVSRPRLGEQEVRHDGLFEALERSDLPLSRISNEHVELEIEVSVPMFVAVQVAGHRALLWLSLS